MAYQYTEFEGVSLPLFDHSQEHAPMASEPTLLDSIGGAYDWRGSQRRKGRKQIISLTGLYVGETEYLVDETGDILTDEGNDPLIAGDAQQMLRAYVVALMEKKGVRGSLWRERLEDGVREWKTARLLQVSWPRVWEDHALKAELTCQFETAMEFWHAESETTTSGNATAGIPLPLLVDNAGQTVDDARITITVTSGTMTAFTLTGDGVSLSWSGAHSSGAILRINCATQTVTAGSTNEYNGFSLGVAHTAAGWLPLSPGANLFMITVTGGNATVAISHYNQYP